MYHEVYHEEQKDFVGATKPFSYFPSYLFDILFCLLKVVVIQQICYPEANGYISVAYAFLEMIQIHEICILAKDK